ncbi:hypothetical protein GCM10010185_42270 [Saccharothrix coeruleofusca]|uniref:Uncharacterized protein n=1 Tax=Saccharothrix coeruleofusca TaxID=33919 RepID=A0A918ASI2_9PSEU|nr:hypothetical protein GCM10010185_42270 [Saccharothrix coeruleofusca]
MGVAELLVLAQQSGEPVLYSPRMSSERLRQRGGTGAELALVFPVRLRGPQDRTVAQLVGAGLR